MGRIFALLIALLGAASLSQTPEFGQQYMQRLAGAVGELRGFSLRFEDDAAAAGIDRNAALEAYARSGTFLSLQGVHISDTLERYDRLDEHLSRLRRANPYERSVLIVREGDMPLLRETAGDFLPAMPLTLAGAVHAGLGFVLGWVIGIMTAGIVGGLCSPIFAQRGGYRRA